MDVPQADAACGPPSHSNLSQPLPTLLPDLLARSGCRPPDPRTVLEITILHFLKLAGLSLFIIPLSLTWTRSCPTSTGSNCWTAKSGFESARSPPCLERNHCRRLQTGREHSATPDCFRDAEPRKAGKEEPKAEQGFGGRESMGGCGTESGGARMGWRWFEGPCSLLRCFCYLLMVKFFSMVRCG
jgi:hypothetical protein